MNNLQICLPYQSCAFCCKMCVARGHKHYYRFMNLYAEDPQNYKEKLISVICAAKPKIDNLIITGECDPTQNAQFVRDVISWVNNRYPVEITTHNQHFDRILGGIHVDTISLSVTNVKEYLSAWHCSKSPEMADNYRLVILLTKEFNFLNAGNFSPMGFNQITFKILQYGEDEQTNKWIEANRMDEAHLDQIREIVQQFNTDGRYSVRLDTNCQEANGRYKIFRSDGKVYPSWESAKAMGEN